MTSTLRLSAVPKTKRAREEDSESETEPSSAQSPVSRLTNERLKLLIPPSLLADRLSSLHIMEEVPRAATSTEAGPREDLSEVSPSSCSSPPFISDDLLNDILRATVPTSVEASSSTLKIQWADALDVVEDDVSELIPIREDPADVLAHASIAYDAAKFSFAVLQQKYPNIYSGETLCANTPSAGRVAHGVWGRRLNMSRLPCV